MTRRDVILLTGAALAAPRFAIAQLDGRIRRVGSLAPFAEDDPEMQARLGGFRQGLERLGWSEGRNVHIDYRFAPDSADYQRFARELVALQPDVIVAQGTGITAALQRASRTVPIVFITVSDPVGSGFIDGLARPGRNLTGLLGYEASITGKWLAMLKEITPGLARAALMANPRTTPFDYFLREAQVLAPSLALDVVASRIETAADIEGAIDSFARVPNGGLVLLPDGTTQVHRDLIIALAARHRLPAVYSARVFVAAGGLMSYDADRIDQMRQAAIYVHRILRGDKPTDLPVQAPVKYTTVLNLKTAKALGLDVPPGLLIAADEVIE